MTRSLRGRFCGIATALLIVLAVVTVHAAEDFEVPKLTGAVVDRAGLLMPVTRQRLEGALRDLQRKGGTQLVVLTLPNLSGLTIEQASIRVVDAWELGGEEADNGVLLLVARDERRVRIEVGQGLEGELPDAFAKRIVDEAMTPLFKSGDFDGGVTIGVYQIAKVTNPAVNLLPHLEGSLRAQRTTRTRRSPGQSLLFLLLGLPLLLMRGMGMGRFGRRRGAYYLGAGMLGAGLGSRGGFGGGGLGGFGGGGGGFSGGGASGGW
jgi:uncharacterized protein